ncbi:hypothetical protein IFR05_008224 [Cadophora sp. M221]|nr:hypothetical protein IFR05_008224 [Cadophora sp. M221]
MSRRSQRIAQRFSGEFAESRGFYTVRKTPTALKVSQESRDAVKKSYVECFSSLWFPRGTLFNFAMDTLDLSRDFIDNVPAFLHTFREKETTGIRYIAIEEADFDNQCDCEECGSSLTGPNKSKQFRNALKGLTALEEVTIVYDFEW